MSCASVAEDSREPINDPSQGKQSYFDHGCYACHGYNGVGKKNLVNGTSGIMSNESVFLIFLRARGDLNPALPTQSMPHYPKESLNDEDAKAIYRHILTFKDNPPEVEGAPALRAILDGAK